MPQAFSIEVFLPDGDPDGIKIVQKVFWSGEGLIIPRALFARAKQLEQLDRPGVYVLVGTDDTAQLPRVYVGEGDPVLPRLLSHGRSKDFWSTAIVFTTQVKSLDKAFVQHLEAQLVERARVVRRCTIENGNLPQLPTLSQAAFANVERYLDDMLQCLGVLGYTYFEKPAQPAAASLNYQIKRPDGVAQGYETAQGFVVQQGSYAASTETRAIPPYVSQLRQDLRASEVLVPNGPVLAFTQDYAFTSPSTAAAVVVGGSVNGRTVWKTKDGHTLKSVQDAATTP